MPGRIGVNVTKIVRMENERGLENAITQPQHFMELTVLVLRKRRSSVYILGHVRYTEVFLIGVLMVLVLQRVDLDTSHAREHATTPFHSLGEIIV